MKPKKIGLVLIVLLSVGIYFLLYHKDKSLKFIPENSDAVILIDKKKLIRQYISALAVHPSEWFGSRKKEQKQISIFNSGIKIPDYVQIFHLKNSKLNEWYSVFEIESQEKLSAFLKGRKFQNLGNNLYRKDFFYIKIENNLCIAGTSKNLDIVGKSFYGNSRTKILNADVFMEEGIGSVAFISESRTSNISIELKDNRIEFKKGDGYQHFLSLISELNKENLFINADLDQENLSLVSRIFPTISKDSLKMNRLKMNAKLELKNDTIITYGYDEDFNEVQKLSYQKIVQPEYFVQIETKNKDEVWNYFKNKKWLNDKNEFVAIPFQPNTASKTKNGIEIKSQQNSALPITHKNKNFVLVKNDPLLFSLFKGLNDFKLLKNTEYLFYGNDKQSFFLTLKFKDKELPLILQ